MKNPTPNPDLAPARLEPPTCCYPLFGGQVNIKAYSQPAAVLETPALPEQIIAVHCSGSALAERRLTGAWQSARMQRGAVSLIPPMTVSRWRLHGPCTFLHFTAGADWLLDFARRHGRHDATLKLQPVFGHRDTEIERLAFLVWEQVQRPRELSTGAVELGVQLLLISALQTYAERPAQSSRTHPAATAAVRLALQHIEAHLDSPLRVADLARRAKLSESALIRSFRRSVGRSPYAYLQHRRMEHAKVLLRTTRLPIAQVAELVGYTSSQHFATVFRRASGKPPRDYRSLE